MADIKKTIELGKFIKQSMFDGSYKQNPAFDEGVLLFTSNALELLKEQEALKPIYDEQEYGDHLPHCRNCKKVLPNNAVYGKVNFCHFCGQAVKWNA